jgi:predicted transcriptional regulator/antitoxin component HigA of HigAB toxin-antitoxin module
MPGRISSEKETRIIEQHIQGLSQTDIAENLDVSQSTVSAVISRYKKGESTTTPDGASVGKGVLDEVDKLRSLSVDLRKAAITVDEAKIGSRLADELTKLGGSFDMLSSLIAAYRKILPKDFPVKDFVEAATQLIRLENESGMTYKDLMSTYEDTCLKLVELNKQIEDGNRDLNEIVKKRKEADADLQKQLEENRITLPKVQQALEIRGNLDKFGLSLEKGEIVGNMLRLFSNLIESKGLSSEKAAADLEKFLENTLELDQAGTAIKAQVEKFTNDRDSLAEDVDNLKSEKTKLELENSFLKEATTSVIELREKHGIGVDQIVKMRSLAQKYGPPASILQTLDTYRSFRDLQEQKTGLEGSIEELTQTEALLRGKIKTVEEELAALPAKTDESIKGVKSSLQKFSDQVQDLGDVIGKASTHVDELKESALAAGREIAAIESRVAAYKLTSTLINFVVKGTGEENDVVPVVIPLLDRLSKWVENQPKYSKTKQQIESLKEKIEGQMVVG